MATETEKSLGTKEETSPSAERHGEQGRKLTGGIPGASETKVPRSTDPRSAETEKTAGAAESDSVGPGRPKGAKNRQKPGLKPLAPRKVPEDVKQKSRAIDRDLERVNALIREHNKEHRESLASQYQPIQLKRMSEPSGLKPAVPEAVCTQAIAGLCAVIGLALKVQTRPEADQLRAAGAAWAEVTKYLVNVSPMVLAVMTAVGTTVVCVAPMVVAKIVGEVQEAPKLEAANG